MRISAIEKYAILKERLSTLIRIEVDRYGGWTVPGQMVSLLTTEGPQTWVPRPTRDWTSAVEVSFHILAQSPVSTDLGETWEVFDAESYLKSRGKKILWVPYKVEQPKSEESLNLPPTSGLSTSVGPVATDGADATN